jgi:hypothetical protein
MGSYLDIYIDLENLKGWSSYPKSLSKLKGLSDHHGCAIARFAGFARN